MNAIIQYRNIRLFSPFIFILFFFSSCSYPHLYHSPNMMAVPLFNKSAEFSGIVSGSFGAVNPSFEMQTAFSIPGHIALGGEFMTGGNNHSGETYVDNSKYNYFEGFGGYYTSFNKIGVFEIYAGYGGGNQKHTFAYNEWTWSSGDWVQDGIAEIKFSNIFIQPDIGVRTKIIEGAFSFRLTRVDLRDIYFESTTYRLTELQLLQSNSVSWLLEPGFTFRAGHDPVKFQIQGVFSATPYHPDLSFEHFRFNLGVNIKFGMKKDSMADDSPGK